MLITKNQTAKNEFQVELNGKTVKHSRELLILGNLMNDQLTWSSHVTKVLIPALTNKIRTLELLNKYLDRGYKAVFTNSTFRSTLMFGLETWGGAPRNINH